MPTSNRHSPGTSRLQASAELFDQWFWFYALCREYLFRDHTAKISQSLFPPEGPLCGTRILEMGCGPGLYARSLARRYPQVSTTGIDLSQRLIRRAETRAARHLLSNCDFHVGDARAVPFNDRTFDAVVVSRLFLIVRNQEAVLSEVFRVLRPGGRCFIAEPTSSFKTQLPLHCMRLLARFMGSSELKVKTPDKATVLSPQQFQSLIRSQQWSRVHFEMDGSYQCAVCNKPADNCSESREVA